MTTFFPGDNALHRLIRNIYLLAALIVVFLLLGWSLHYVNTSRSITSSAQKVAELSVASLGGEISGWLTEQARVIENAAAFIALERWDDEDILAYLEALLKSSEGFSSIYYGCAENRMVNASGWEPPSDFDLRTRPWYTKAAAERQTVYTEAFVNASKDLVIVTIGAPVFNRAGDMIGVIGGDVSIYRIIALVREQNPGPAGFSFLVDGHDQVLAHPDQDYDPGAGFISLQNILDPAAGAPAYKAGGDLGGGLAEVTINNEAGYLAFLPVERTDWHLATFIPLSDFMQSSAQARLQFLFTLFATILVFLFFIFYHNRYVERPLLQFDKNIRQIDLENSLAYRLPVDSKGEFANLGKTINRLLDRVESYFLKLTKNEEALKEANFELANMLQQLTTAEEALDYSEEKLYFLSYHDQLTRLYNRSFFDAKLRQLDSKQEYPVTVIFADINGLKLINDTMGHSAGDRLLKNCADLLKEALEEQGILSRIGGDEFAVILPLTDRADGENIARQVRYRIFIFNEGKPDLPLSLSLGVATSSGPEDSIVSLVKQAEDLMFRDKLHYRGSNRNSVVQSLMATLAERDFFTEGHARRLEGICLELGEVVGLSSRQLSDLALLAQVHDLGKVGIPDQILYKPGPLDDDEWEIMKQHCEKGYRIACTSPDLTGVADLILKHHEHWNGGGYPLGLKGTEIPIACRILAIADAFDAMTNDRPYKQSRTAGEAIKELQACAGTQFDPEMVNVFLALKLDQEISGA